MAVVTLAGLGRYDALYLSPHLDDVALSCTGRLGAERRRGRKALVVTLFATGGPEHVLRRREDERASELLGVDVLWGEFPDAPFRSPRYGSFSGIVLDRDPDDAAWLTRARTLIARLVAETGAERVHAPMAVGGHIDHRLTHEAAAAEVDPRKLWFYEDRPYALVRGMVELRLRDLGEPVRPLSTGAALRLAADFARAGYVRSYAGTADIARTLSHLLARPGAAAPPASSWKVEMVIESPDTYGVASQVLACYASQWPALFGSLARSEKENRAYSERISPIPGFVERLWGRSGG